MRFGVLALGLLGSGAIVLASPPGFPISGNGLWYSEPAVNWSTQYLPIGNGYLADVRPLPADEIAFGTYSGAGYLNVNRSASGNFTSYARWLDMDDAVLKTTWTEPSGSFSRTYFCSNPTRACTVHTVASAAGAFSATFSFSSLNGLPTRNITCLDSSTIQLRGYAGSPGMLYEILGKIQQSGPANSTAECVVDAGSGDAVLVTKGSTEAWVNWVGGTEYSMETGNAASGYTFKGEDPHLELVTLLAKASAQSIPSALASHVADYHSALGSFSLNLGQKYDNTKTTAQLRAEYRTDVGNPYIEWLVFNYGRYMLIGSTRGYLPANLQGKWARDAANPWFGKPNINLQMNYWFAEMIGLNVTSTLWNYMEKTWVPRGSETARILYNATSGWVVHNAVNTFGHSGMNSFGSDNSAEWANYPEAASWMMLHVYDHFDYTNDVIWWKTQGWPMIKAVASFWVNHLVEDKYFNDGTLVAVPCNSPEQPITTLEVKAKKLRLDKGIKIGSFGQLQEWKVEFDSPTNLHRHLSHLIGLYPGYALTNFKPPTGQDQGIPKLTREQVLRASEVSLISRGNGTGPDGDAGWEKVWRAACWAQLQNAARFYHQLTYAIERNFAENLWSLYNSFTEDPIFQIDANLGYPAAVLNALVQAPDTPSLSDALVITLLPALPFAWGSGSIVGARIRGGMTLDLNWMNGKAIRTSLRVDPAVRYARQVQV
ncbi:unnamed protein product [Rhizoctonia solani]|uniref:Glycoside hydrolase family 95 protein n=1 Tax=Rhizoctonia solani TaxID=456999 RepID=A0A8H3DLL0_9AGAM|nr:unnamed protein product [Rhizoctonia solani]